MTRSWQLIGGGINWDYTLSYIKYSQQKMIKHFIILLIKQVVKA